MTTGLMNFDTVLESLVEESTHGLESEHSYFSVTGVASSVDNQRAADRATAQNVQFILPVPTADTLVDACMFLETSFTTTVSNKVLAANHPAPPVALDYIDQYILRSFPLNNMIKVLTLKINNSSFNHNLNAFKPLHERLLPLSTKLDHMDGCPIFQENESCWATQFAEYNRDYMIHGPVDKSYSLPAFQQTGTIAPAVAADPDTALSFARLVESRTPKFTVGPYKSHRSYYEIESVVSAIVGPDSVTTTTIRFHIREPLFHPLLEVTPNRRALYNIMNYIEVNMSIMPNFYHSLFYSRNLTAGPAEVAVPFSYADISSRYEWGALNAIAFPNRENIRILYKTVAVNRVTLPNVRLYPYMKYDIQYSATQAVVSTDNQKSFSFTLSGITIPDTIAIYVARQRLNDIVNQLDMTTLNIDRLSLRMLNHDGIFASSNPYQLYHMSLKNGLKVSWDEWAYGGKCIILVKPGADFDSVSGTNVKFSLEVTATCSVPKNKRSAVKPVADAAEGNNLDGDYELSVVQAIPAYLLFNGTTITAREGFDVGVIQQALQQDPDHLEGDAEDPERKVGGAFNFKKFFRKTWKSVKKYTPMVNHYAQVLAQNSNNPVIQGAAKHADMFNETVNDMRGSALKLGGKVRRGRDF